MLSLLKIKNIAIIESAEIEFTYGLNVMSGETGAGKSIILDSLNAVLGFRASRELIRTGESEAGVTALFRDISAETENALKELCLPASDDGTLLLTRVISQDKNTCRVNGAPASVAVLRALSSSLVSIHGQQDNRELLDSKTHRAYIDKIAADTELLEEYGELYSHLCSLKDEIASLTMDESEKVRRTELLEYQINELKSAGLRTGERDELISRRDLIRNSEKLNELFSLIVTLLDGDGDTSGALAMLGTAQDAAEKAARLVSDALPSSEMLSEAIAAAENALSEIRVLYDAEEGDPHELDRIEERLDTLYRLGRKYGADEDDMLSFLEKAETELDSIVFSDERLSKLKREYSLCERECNSVAEKLSAVRQSAAGEFSVKVMDELRFLDMPSVTFSARFTRTPLSEYGIDDIEFLISANVGEEPKPIAKIASGGELSRIMLAIKRVLSENDGVGTLVFDEIDAGVSGRAAYKVGCKLAEVSNSRQVLCVTHLTQIAAFADTHLLINKSVRDEKTYTDVTLLDEQGRLSELARIIGGGKSVTSAQLQSARETLNDCTEYKKGHK